jgi:hypothetical protein
MQQTKRLRIEEERTRQQVELLRTEEERTKQHANLLHTEEKKTSERANLLRTNAKKLSRQVELLRIKVRRSRRMALLLHIKESNHLIQKIELTSVRLSLLQKRIRALKAIKTREVIKVMIARQQAELLRNNEAVLRLQSERLRIKEESNQLRQQIAREKVRLSLLEKRIRAYEEDLQRTTSRDNSRILNEAANEVATAVRETVAPPTKPATSGGLYILIIPISVALVFLYVIMQLRIQRNNQFNIPQLAESLIYSLSPKRDAENIIGDLQEELLIIVKESGPFKAKIWLYKQTLLSACPLIYSRAMQVAQRLIKSQSRL